MSKALIWDMDGVLADTGEAHFAAWRRLFAEYGHTMTQRQFQETFGMVNADIIRHCLGDHVPTELAAEMGKRKEELFREMAPGRIRLLPGVAKWLAWGRQRGYRQVVASSGEMANIVTVLSVLGISNYFDALLSGAFLPKSKPDPALFLQAAAAVGVAPEDSLVIEDGIVGVEAAERAGMHCLAVTTTNPAEKLAQADLIVDNLEQVDEEAMERLLGL